MFTNNVAIENRVDFSDQQTPASMTAHRSYELSNDEHAYARQTNQAAFVLVNLNFCGNSNEPLADSRAPSAATLLLPIDRLSGISPIHFKPKTAAVVVDVQGLSTEHSQLVRKKFDTGLSKAETNRLRFIRWSLDRAEEARMGENLDRIETAIGASEQIADQLNQLLKELSRSHPSAIRSRKRD